MSAHRTRSLISAGQMFGAWLALSAEHRRGRYLVVDVKCACGRSKTVKAYDLAKGRSAGCGCERGKSLTKYHVTHGQSKTNTFDIWSGMWERCTQPKHISYRHYGAKGISVCDRWRDFRNFIADMGERPQAMSIDRIDGTKGYSPENCRWVDAKTQSRNRSAVRLYEHGGHKACIPEWSERAGIKPHVLRQRISRGWSIARAIAVPVGFKNRNYGNV